MRFYIWLYIGSLIFNFIWEIAHSRLYVFISPIKNTYSLLFWMSLKDAFFVTLFSLVIAAASNNLVWFKKPTVFQIASLGTLGLVFAINIERHALAVDRWGYLSSMPTVLGLGLSPLIQMSLGSIVTFLAVKYFFTKKLP